jgi:hypothetical protein
MKAPIIVELRRNANGEMIGMAINVLRFAAVGEAFTGLALLIVPSLVGQLLLGEKLAGVAIPVARVAGIALVALGMACWPCSPRVGIMTYSALVTVYLAYLGLADGLTGVLLWPAVILHLILTALLAGEITRMLRNSRQ